MKFKILYLCTATAGLLLAACSSDSTTADVPDVTTDTGDPAGFTLTISEPATRADQQDLATAEESVFVTADVFIYSDNTLSKHVRLDSNDFTLQGDHVYTTDDPIVTTTGTKEIYVGLNMPQALGEAVAATRNKSGLYLLSNIDNYPVWSSDATVGFTMFSIEPAIEELKANYDNKVTAKVGRLVAKVTVLTNPALSLSLDEGELSDLKFALRNMNKLYWPYQKTEGGIVYDPNHFVNEWNSSHFEHHDNPSDYIVVDEYDYSVVPEKVKYPLENTSDQTLTRETTYASVRAEFIPKYFAEDDGSLVANQNTSAVDFWIVKLDETGESYFFDDYTKAETFAKDRGEISDIYENGYCYYNLFINPDNDFQTLRNTFYQLRITSITGVGNPNPEDKGDTDKPVTRPANLELEVDIQPWSVQLDDYDLF
ncbi:MAG: Mfa1 family fimbria major subunit [Alistipes sp.]|nr:Mfa1 family fimbria major subunit [Alistipes sp.]